MTTYSANPIEGVSNLTSGDSFFDAALQHIFFGLSRNPFWMGTGRSFVAAALFDLDRGTGRSFVAAALFDLDAVDNEIGQVPVRAITGLWVFEEPNSHSVVDHEVEVLVPWLVWWVSARTHVNKGATRFVRKQRSQRSLSRSFSANSSQTAVLCTKYLVQRISLGNKERWRK